jgi:DNA-binding CsgD family transcriptional regulator
MENVQDHYRIIEFIVSRMSEGVVVLDEKMDIVLRNRSAELFLGRFSFPDEVRAICKRMFDAMKTGKFEELFPGEVRVYKKIAGSPGRWTFHFHVHENRPLACVFIHEESLSEKLDLNKVRKHFGLTRREMDVIRRVINGLSNDDIAKEFEISEQTIKDHLSCAYQKVGVRNRVELLTFLFNSESSSEEFRQGDL